VNLKKEGLGQQRGIAEMAHIRKSWEDSTIFSVIKYPVLVANHV